MIRRPPRSTRTDTLLSLHDALPILLLLINANPLINKTHHQIFTQPPDIDEQVATIRWGIFIRVLDQVGKNTPQKHLVSFNMFKAGYVVIDMEAGIPDLIPIH